jgi:release factor glutamine methyltransferase
MTETTVRDLIATAGLPVSEARILLMHVLGVSRTWLIAHDTDTVDAAVAARFGVLAQRRVGGEPIAYLVGWREFMGHVFRVSPAELIPRPETELLVETGLACIQGIRAPRILDLGTGSGAIAISLALARPDAEVVATDASGSALAVARANAATLGARVSLCRGDWWTALDDTDRGTGFDLIVSNPPYIASRDAHLGQGDLRFEPPGALTDYADGLAALRTIATQAPAYLRPGAALWLEHGYDQAQAVRNLLVQAGLKGAHSLRDLAGIERISGAFYNPSISSSH